MFPHAATLYTYYITAPALPELAAKQHT